MITPTMSLNGHSDTTRHSADRPCPVCGGCDRDHRGAGLRCHGYSKNGWANCSREEHAHLAEYNPGSNTWSHKLTGNCPCGTSHAPAHATPKSKDRKGTFESSYQYFDADNVLRHETIRFKNPKGFAQRRPGPDGKPIWSLKGTELVLYRLPQLMEADPSRPVWVVEGEKDCDRLAKLGQVATTNPMGAATNPMGAKKWRPQFSESLRGRHVLIIPDNDDPGRQHAEQVARSLSGVAASVKIVMLPGLPDKGDVSDFLDAGGTIEQLSELANEAMEWLPSIQSGDKHVSNDHCDNHEVNEAEDDPHRLARLHLKKYQHGSGSMLRCYRGDWVGWLDGAYRSMADPELQAGAAAAVKNEFDRLNQIAVKKWEKNGAEED